MLRSETVGFRTRPVWDQKIDLGLGLAGLVLCCERRSCHARRRNDLEGHSNFSITIYSFSILCLEHHYCGDQQWRSLIMRPSSPGGGRILRRTLSVRLSVRPVSGCTLFTVAPSYERTSKIEKLRFSLIWASLFGIVLFGTRRGPHIVRAISAAQTCLYLFCL